MKKHILVIDPSIGSANSQPAICLVDRPKGRVLELRTLGINPKLSKWQRLRLLHLALQPYESAVDQVVIEDIPYRMSRRFVNISLHQAVGVIAASFDCPVAFIPIRAWQSYTKQYLPDYQKSDCWDAYAMACAYEGAVLKLAKGVGLGSK